MWITVLLKRLYVLVFIEHGTRRIHLAGITAHPDGVWTVQQARNLAMTLGERLGEMRILKSPPQATRANAVCERLIGTLRREVLDHLLILNEAHLRAVLTEPAAHYNAARSHQGIAQRVPDHDCGQPTAQVVDLDTARIRRRPVLAGITSEYQIAA